MDQSVSRGHTLHRLEDHNIGIGAPDGMCIRTTNESYVYGSQDASTKDQTDGESTHVQRTTPVETRCMYKVCGQVGAVCFVQRN